MDKKDLSQNCDFDDDSGKMTVGIVNTFCFR